jgi:nucleotide-binding universal stress UspA family protein
MVFERTIVGYDGSPGSERALALALRLSAADAKVVALTVAETHYAMHAGMDAVAWAERMNADATAAREAAERELAGVPGAHAEVVAGHAGKSLLDAAAGIDADLIALGSCSHGRVSGMLLGSVAAQVLHDAPCSVLVARGEGDIADFPRTIAVAADGSTPSRHAAAAADAIGRATGASVQQLNAGHSPARDLIEASRSSDLLVIPGGGRPRLHARGSVVERVAHRAACPVLVVRAPQAEQFGDPGAAPFSTGDHGAVPRDDQPTSSGSVSRRY